MIQRIPRKQPSIPAYKRVLDIVFFVPGKIISFFRAFFDEFVLLGVSLFLFLVATNTQSGWLFFVIAFSIGLLLLSLFNSILNLRKISIKRIFSDIYHEDESIKVTLRVYNNSRIPKFFLLLEDPFPSLYPESKNPQVYIPFIPAGGYRDISYERLAYKRGVYTYQPVKILTAGALGFFSLRKKISAEGERLVVLPRSFKSISFSLNGTAPRAARGERSHRFAGLSYDFTGIREYRPGNETRHIHWPSTARQGQLMVKEFNDVTTHAVTLLLDTHEIGDFGQEKDTTIEHMVRTAATIVKEARSGNFLIDFIHMGNNRTLPERNISPMKTHMRLAEIQAGAQLPLDVMLPGILQDTRQQSHLFILKVLPFVDFDWIKNLAPRQINTTVIFFDPRCFVPEEDPEYLEVQKISYARSIEKMTRAGIRIYMYNPVNGAFMAPGGKAV